MPSLVTSTPPDPELGPLIGANWRTNALWTDTGLEPFTNENHFYGISDVMIATSVAVPEPPSFVVFGLLAFMASCGRADE